MDKLLTNSVFDDYYNEVTRFGNNVNSLQILRKYVYPKLDFNLAKEEIELQLIHLNSYFLAKVFKTDKFLILLEDWFNDKNQIKSCQICGTKFKVTMLPGWVYQKSNGCNICCFTCEIMEKPIGTQLLINAKEFVSKCNFIPNSNYGPEFLEFSSRIDDKNWKDILISYGKLGRPNYIKEQKGTWFKLLVEAGCLAENVLITKRGVKCLAIDGNECNSLAEQYISNWLFGNNIQYEKEPKYPYHPELNKKCLKRADWKIKNTLVEYFGLEGDEKYDKKTFDKLKIIQDCNLELISVFPKDLGSLDRLFSKFKTEDLL